MSTVTIVLSSLAKKFHYSNLKIKDVNDNKKFWKIVKPPVSEKVAANENMTLVDNNNVISSNIEIAGKLVKELNIKIKEDLLRVFQILMI